MAKRKAEPPTPAAGGDAFRNRIKELRWVKPSELADHPDNWREHPSEQREALRAVLSEIGYANAALARELPDGRLELIDGHLRKSLADDESMPEGIPVLVLEVSEQEAKTLLATMDPLAAMAEASVEKFEALLADIETDSDALRQLLDGECAKNAASSTAMEKVDARQAPAFMWVLIGVPTVRYGAIARLVEEAADIDQSIVETTYNDG